MAESPLAAFGGLAARAKSGESPVLGLRSVWKSLSERGNGIRKGPSPATSSGIHLTAQTKNCKIVHYSPATYRRKKQRTTGELLAEDARTPNRKGKKKMVAFIFPTAEQITVAGAIKTPYATGVLKLFKSQIDLTLALAAADLAAIEADFSGYAAITLTTLPPVFVDGNRGGVSFQIPTQQWNVSDPATIQNDIYGGWIETAGGVLLMAWELLDAWPMTSPHSALALDVLINTYGTNQVYVNINDLPQ